MVVPLLKQGEQRAVSYTLSSMGAFVPGAGDSVKIEIDKTHKVPEIKLDNNTGSDAYPF